MPFTPLHFGYGALFHAASPARVSFLAFCAVNALIDVEPLYYMVTDQYPIHRFAHTLIGAALAAICILVFHYVVTRPGISPKLPNLLGWKELPRISVALGAVLGACSHVVLDSIMHDDMRPLAPFGDHNPLLRLISIDQLGASCLAAAVLAVLLLALRNSKKGAERAL